MPPIWKAPPPNLWRTCNIPTAASASSTPTPARWKEWLPATRRRCPCCYASLPALNAGRYEVTVHYAADSTPESTAAGQVVFQTGQAVDVSAAMTLEGTVNTFTGHFWLLNAVPAQDAGVLVYACNTDFRFISLEVRELWSWRLVQWISAAVVFAALDLVLLCCAGWTNTAAWSLRRWRPPCSLSACPAWAVLPPMAPICIITCPAWRHCRRSAHRAVPGVPLP